MDDFDLTQRVSLCYEDDPIDEANDVAILKIPLQNGIPKELEFSLHDGLNKIGRSESCDVCIKTKVLSKEHAVIEVCEDCYNICDLNSSNKTWKGKKSLKPNVKYRLEPLDEVSFGTIKAQFLVKKEGDEARDSGSETGSESMLLLNEEYCAFSTSSPIKNTGADEVGANSVGNASTSKTLFPQNSSNAEKERVKSPKDAAEDLQNAPTQAFNGAVFCDSDAETDCEDHSEEKTVTKGKVAPHLENVSASCHKEVTVKKHPTNNKTCGESSKGSENLANQTQVSGKILNVQPSENSFNKHQNLPPCHSLDDSSEELPPTQVNLDLLELHKDDDCKSMSNKKMNSEYKGKVLESLDSLPETQVNTISFDVDFEVPESPQQNIDDNLPPTQCVSSHIENDDLPPTQCVSSHVEKDDLPPTQCVSSHVEKDDLPPTQHVSSHVRYNISKINNNILKHKFVLPEFPAKSENSDDLPPTQVNLALQFSEEQNFLQRDDSQSSCENNTSSPKPSTSSGISNSRNALQSSSSRKRSTGCSRRGLGGTSGRESVADKSSKTLLLSCINISVEEGSPSGGGTSILCPSTQRRSERFDHKIKNTDINCSPTLSKGSDENVKDSIDETPPHLLKESAVACDTSSTVSSFSARLAEVSPIAVQNSASTSSSLAKTSDDHHTPDTYREVQPNASTPDSAKAGILNYSVNYSPKVYKPKLNDMDQNTQEILQLEKIDKEATTSGMPKNLSKEPEHPKKPEERLDIVNDNKTDSGDNTGSGRKSRTNRKRRATRKTDNEATVSNISPEKSSSESNSTLKTKAGTRKAAGGIKSLNSSSHVSETNNYEESDNLNGVPQKRRSKRGNAKNIVSDISKKLCFESDDNDKSEEQNPTAKPQTEKSDDPSMSLANMSDFKSKRLARKKKPEIDESIQQLPSKRNKRQKCILDDKSSENGDICGDDVSVDVTKEISEIDFKNNSVATPARKSARRKPLQFEPDGSVADRDQEVSFSVFRKSDALESEKDSLLDTRASKRRKVNPAKDVCKTDTSLVTVQSNKRNLQSLNESEISVSSSGEHCNVVVQENRSHSTKTQKSGKSTEDNSCVPAAQPQTRGKAGKSEISGGKTAENDEQKSEQTEESPLKGKRNRHQRKSPQVRPSRKKEIPDNTSADNPLDSNASLDTSSKTENEDSLLNKSKKISGKSQASKSKQLQEEVVLHSNSNLEDASGLSVESSSRSLKLRLSASETSTDETPGGSEKCRISIFAKDSVMSLIKLDSQNLGKKQKDKTSSKSELSKGEDVSEKEENDVLIQGVKKGRQSRSKFNLKEENDRSDVSVQRSKKGRQARSKFNFKDEENVSKKEDNSSDVSVQAVKRGRQAQSKFNLQEEEDEENKSDVSVPGAKKGRQARLSKFKEEEEKEDNKSDVSVPGAKKGRQARQSKFKEEEEKEDNKSDVSVKGVKTGRQARRSKFNMKEKEEEEDNSDISVQRAKKSRLGQSKLNFTEDEEEDNKRNISVQKVKKGRQSQLNSNMKDDLCSPLTAKKSKQCHDLDSSSISDTTSANDTTPAKNKKAKTTKNVTLISPSSRPQNLKPKVMFTLVEDDEPQKVVINLGGKVVEDVNACTHLVAEKMRRTVKALCCIGKGIPLVNTKWIQECKKSESFVDHMPYLIKDKAVEKQYHFELQKTLQQAAEKPILSSWSIHVTPKVVPSPDQMKDIIQCAGGKYLPKMPNRLSEKTVVISCAADLNLCSHAIKCGIPVVGAEFILTGLLQYKIDTRLYALSKK